MCLTLDIARLVTLGFALAAIISMFGPAIRAVRETPDILQAFKGFYGLAPLSPEATRARNQALIRWGIGFALLMLAFALTVWRAAMCGPPGP